MYPSEFQPNQDTSQAFSNHGLMIGRMVNHEKRAPEGHDVVWNANVYTPQIKKKFLRKVMTAHKLWYGDLDLTADREKLEKIATDLAVELYILRERDGRFENEQNPQLSRAVAIIEPK